MTIHQLLPAVEIVAHNYGAAHANKIHSDEGAEEHGYAGALVPGIGLYAYLARPVVEALGNDWLEHGTMLAKFLKPVYDQKLVRVQAAVVNVQPITLTLELFNSHGLLCATGSASLPLHVSELNATAYERRSLPPREQLRPATIAAICAGEVFGSLEFTLDLKGELTKFRENVVDSSPRYDAICHPAYWIAQANEVVMQNVALGMWIHTASETQHYALARDGEPISTRSRVVETFEKRGHELIMLDIGIFGESDRAIAQIKHTAIIKLREPQ